ncbi:hypothetical protein CICLE_v10004065mg [Citrus x clementina]|uniref:Uncharacterized protein n=1 Tax=Citrus clementina TaxID=85681 RepID=V4SZX0_CITCL|nr:hypothetical protein CICLE_v10004065mg [Citrus x clementina]
MYLEHPHVLHIRAFMGLEDLRKSCISYRAFPRMIEKWRNHRLDVVSCPIFKEQFSGRLLAIHQRGPTYYCVCS